MRTSWSFYSAGQIEFGRGACRHLGALAGRRKLRRVFIVTDANLERAGVVARVESPLREAGIECAAFTGGQAEPAIRVAEEAAAAGREFRPDGILGLGGGSNMDLAKFVAILLTHGGKADRYFGFDQVPGPVMPLICVPTTSGTGSEVSHAAVLTDTDNQLKVSTLSMYLRPALALVDPALTDGCPRKVTADSGIDALTHAIEGYTAIDFDKYDAPDGEPVAYGGRHPLGQTLAEKAIELIGKHLVAAVRNGGDTAARDGMSLAATTAGLAFSNCAVAVVHALEYPVGAAVHCSHGEGNGLLLPHVMRFNLPERVESFARIAALLGENVEALSTEQAAGRAITAVERIGREIGIPQRLRDIGVKREQLAGFAEKAFAIKRLMNTNPRRPTQADLLAILEAAY